MLQQRDGQKVPDRRTATAYHEAGHTVVAWRLGADPKSATIVSQGAVQGEMTQESPFVGADLKYDGSDHVRNRIERAIMICLAGPMAQRHFSARSWRSWHGGSDYAMAFDLALRVNGSPKAARAHLKWLEIRVQALIVSLWDYVEAIAGELLSHGTLSTEEIRSTLSPMRRRGD